MKRIFATAVLCLSAFLTKAQQDNTLSANDYIFFPGNEFTLPPNGVVTLSVKHLVNDAPADVVLNSEQWTIDGNPYTRQDTKEGNFQLAALQLDKGNYKAPASVPPHNPVVITLSFQPEGQQTKIILYCRIHIMDKENYFWLSSGNNAKANGELYELKEPLVASMRMESAYYVNDQWNIGANGLRKTKDNDITQYMNIGASIVGNGTGTYKWTVHGNDKTGLTPPCNIVTVTGTAGSLFQYTSADCVPHGDDKCKLTAREGSTTITVFDKQKKIIKGYFSGQLVSVQGQYVWASGAFSVKMK